MEKTFNEKLLKQEAETAEIEQDLSKLLQEWIKAQVVAQIDAVCRKMEPQLIASWERGGFGEELVGQIHIELPEDALSYTYKEVANKTVRNVLRAYGFNVYYNAHLREKDAVAHLHFNFTNAFYGDEKNWCYDVAQAYLTSKVAQTVSTLWDYIDAKCLSMRPLLEKQEMCENDVLVSVKLPPAAKKIVAERVCEAMPTVCNGYVLEGLDRIIFKLRFPLM